MIRAKVNGVTLAFSVEFNAPELERSPEHTAEILARARCLRPKVDAGSNQQCDLE